MQRIDDRTGLLPKRPESLPRVRASDHARQRARRRCAPARARCACGAAGAERARARARLARALSRRGPRDRHRWSSTATTVTGSGAPNETLAAMRVRRRGDLPGRVCRTTRGTASAISWCASTRRHRSARGATKRGTPSSRATASRTSSCNSASTPSSSRVLQGLRASTGCTSSSAPASSSRFAYRDFAAYYRSRPPALSSTPSRGPTATSPYPVAHCSLCDHERTCERPVGRRGSSEPASPASAAIRCSG